MEDCSAKHEDKLSRMSLSRLVEIVERLRGEGGCPWDRKQTHQSLKPQLVEEAYEVVDAIDSGDPGALAEELGDILLHVVFHSQLAKEKGQFDITDVIDGIVEKMIRRHPHVFGGEEVDSTKEVLRNWERMKQEEKGDSPSVMDGIPEALPALIAAFKVQAKAARLGFDWRKVEDVIAKVNEEIAEFGEALDSGNRDSMEDEMGDLLFAVVNLARFCEVDPELALRRTLKKFISRFKHIEEYAASHGIEIEDMSLEEMDAIWEAAKGGQV